MLSPIDLIPEFILVIGPLDDVIVVALAFRYTARRCLARLLFEQLMPMRRDRQSP